MPGRNDNFTVFRKSRRAAMVTIVPLAALLVTLIANGAAVRASGAKVLERALDATLVVLSDDNDAQFLGSAFLFGDGTVALTSAHVIKKRDSVTLRARDGSFASGKVTARDPVRDIAVIALPGAPLGTGLDAASSVPALGDGVFALGAPLETEFSVTGGIVSAPGRQLDPAVAVRLIQHDAALNPGSSGGPLVNGDGQVIGINARIADGSRLYAGISYAVPLKIAQRLIAGDLHPVPRLGLTARPVTVQIARALGLNDAAGVLVDNVEIGGRAAQAGIMAGDLLTAVNGNTLTAPAELSFAVEEAGEVATLTLKRGTETLELVMDLGPERSRSLSLSAGGGGLGRVDVYSWQTLGIWFSDGDPVIERISKSSPAYRAGLAEKDRLIAINGTPIEDDAFRDAEIREAMLLLVDRAGRTLHILVDPWTNALPDVPIGGANALDPAVSVF